MERTHCGKCGSPIYFQYLEEKEWTSLATSSIDDQSVKGKLPKPTEHIFLEEKAAWYDLPDDGLAKYKRFANENDSEKAS